MPYWVPKRSSSEGIGVSRLAGALPVGRGRGNGGSVAAVDAATRGLGRGIGTGPAMPFSDAGMLSVTGSGALGGSCGKTVAAAGAGIGSQRDATSPDPEGDSSGAAGWSSAVT